MPPIDTLVTFFSASVLLALAPGPDNLFVLTQAALRGKGSGLVIMLGLCTGLVMHTLAVAFGVAVIFQSSTLAFSILKYIGAGYLVYLAVQAFRAPAGQIPGESASPADYRKLYGRGVIMNITNPKVSIFFLAFLPQFADPAKGPVAFQMLVLGGLFILATLLVFGTIAFLAGFFGQILNRSENTQKVLNKLAGTVFFGLALKLAAAEK